MPALNGQVIIVTGATSGIGEATARRLVHQGAFVVMFGRRLVRLTELAGEIDPTHEFVLPIAGDITIAADREKLVALTLEKFGRIDGLVNNAGYGTRGPVEIAPIDVIRKKLRDERLFAHRPHAARAAGHARTRHRLHRQHRLGRRQDRPAAVEHL